MFPWLRPGQGWGRASTLSQGQASAPRSERSRSSTPSSGRGWGQDQSRKKIVRMFNNTITQKEHCHSKSTVACHIRKECLKKKEKNTNKIRRKT